MENKIVEELKNEDMNQEYRDYIVAVVSYLDSAMQGVDLDKTYEKMKDVVLKIQNMNTGVPTIDNIVEAMKKNPNEGVSLSERLKENKDTNPYFLVIQPYVNNLILKYSKYGNEFIGCIEESKIENNIGGRRR